MNSEKVKNVVIAGGGTAGWMAAASLSKLLGKSLNVTLVESDEIGTVGVGEATIPPIRTLHKLLNIDEQAFMRATNSTFKLGIEFSHWGQINDSYIHSFGVTGKECWAGEFHHFWLRGKELGINVPFGDYCYELQASKQGKFSFSANSPMNFAYHLDATLYAQFLRDFCADVVTRIEGKIATVNKHTNNGFIRSLTLES
ncbi:MAG: tryptophan 7-halogenase, partial [Paraglaciecola chathamensis]